jgi:hypothetical protein
VSRVLGHGRAATAEMALAMSQGVRNFMVNGIVDMLEKYYCVDLTGLLKRAFLVGI